MPQASGLAQNPILSQIAVDFKNREYIADKVLTPVSVPLMQGRYIEWDRGVTFKTPKTAMAQNGQANMLEIKGTVQSFLLATHALQSTVDPLERSQAPEAQIEAMKTVKLTNALLLNREIETAAAVIGAGYDGDHTDDLSGNDQWSDYAAGHSDPVRAVIAAHDALPSRANTFLAGRDVISALRTHPVILDALRLTSSAGLASLEQLARLFEVDEVLIGDAFKDTAGEGLTEDRELVWQEAAGGGIALLFYRDKTPPSPLMDQPTLGYLPTMGGGVPSLRTYKWLDQNYGTEGGVTRIKVETAYKPLISAPNMAFLWTSVLS